MKTCKAMWCFAVFMAAANIFAVPASEKLVKKRPGSNAVALTFDDGPDPRGTPKILKILAHYDVPATFFVVGQNAQAHPELIREIFRQGHAIENHSFSHADLSRIFPLEAVMEMERTSGIIHEITGQRPKCLRPPYGGVNRRVRTLAKKLGLAVVTWDLDSFDYRSPSVHKLVSAIVMHARPTQVILFHDGGGRRVHTIAALPQIIEGLKKRGFGFERICE